jgi:hypothetical protein
MRLLDEHAELSSRIRKLGDYLQDPRFMGLAPKMRVLLLRQFDVMLEYSGILADRLEIEAKTSPTIRRLLGGLAKQTAQKRRVAGRKA